MRENRIVTERLFERHTKIVATDGELYYYLLNNSRSVYPGTMVLFYMVLFSYRMVYNMTILLKLYFFPIEAT